MARAATSPELALYRTPGKWSVLRCAILTPPIVYRARINQTFATFDQVLEIVFDGGSGTLSNVLPDMEVWIGSSLDAHDKGICRLRDKDATHFYLSETSDIQFANDDFVTILAGFGAWARPVRIATGGTVYMDETAYSDQHTNWDPMPNMGPHKVAELTGSSVNVGFDGSASFCPGSSISAWSWSCATASASAGTTTSTCTLQFDTTGWHIVYLTLTAANGKSFWGVRYVYIWDRDNPPPQALISNPGRVDVDSGGWEIELTLFSGAALSDFYDRAMVVLFAEDHYGDTVDEIGPVAGAENIRFIGWISGEAHHLESEQPAVTFRAHGAAYWMTQIPSWPDGVEITAGAGSWTRVPGLTVDLGVYHFLRWRSTITRIMDVTLTGDTRYSPEVSSSAQNLWAQLQDMTWAQIYARPGVNALNQLSVQIHPCLIPTASRTFPTVLAITQADYQDGLDFERAIVDEVGIVDMSGVAVNASGVGSAFFALAPGHSLPHYGEWDLQPNVLISDQAQVITQAGLYRSWRNNPLKGIPIVFDAPIALLDCFPNQKCTISIQADDNVRGYAYSGGLIPTAVALVQDPDTGYLHTEASFEAETSESQARVGDTPGSGDTSGPVSPSFPPLPPLPPILPGVPPVTTSPVRVLAHDPTAGLVYTENFDNANPTWITVNSGLTLGQARAIDKFVVTPTGGVYVINRESNGNEFIAYAPSIGATFTIIEDNASITAKLGANIGTACLALGCNALTGQVAYVIAMSAGAGGPYTAKLYIGTGTTFSAGCNLTIGGGLNNARFATLTYGLGKWIFTSCVSSATDRQWFRISANGATMEATANVGDSGTWASMRASTTGRTFHYYTSADALHVYENNCASGPTVVGSSLSFSGGALRLEHEIACDPTGSFLLAKWPTSTSTGKSSDGGVTWVGGGSIPAGSRVFCYAGPGDSYPRFVAAGATVYYTPDFGGTWHNRTGNLGSLVLSPSIDQVLVLEY